MKLMQKKKTLTEYMTRIMDLLEKQDKNNKNASQS